VDLGVEVSETTNVLDDDQLWVAGADPLKHGENMLVPGVVRIDLPTSCREPLTLRPSEKQPQVIGDLCRADVAGVAMQCYFIRFAVMNLVGVPSVPLNLPRCTYIKSSRHQAVGGTATAGEQIHGCGSVLSFKMGTHWLVAVKFFNSVNGLRC
jgi:hypothetical protein